MASPAIAGSAILLKALRPRWTPGAIKSALMTTSVTDLRKEDLTTTADPFDMGAGRVDLTDAAEAPIVFDESGTKLGTDGANPATAINLNLPSINLPTMPGSITVTRTATNVSGRPYAFSVGTTAPAGSKIRVSPNNGWIKPGGTQTFRVTVTSTADSGRYFGAIVFRSDRQTSVRIPVAWNDTQGAVTLTQSCDPAALTVGALTTCTVTAQNLGGYGADSTVSLDSTVSSGLRIESVTGGTATGTRTASSGNVLLAAKKDSVPSIAAVDPANTPGEGFFDLAGLGIRAVTIGDQELINFNVAPFVYGGQTFSRIGVASDGYVVLGGGVSADISNVPQRFPNPAKPNGVLAPYWTDLDGTGSPGVRVASLGSAGQQWLVIQWNVHLAGDTTPAGQRAMQVWIGLNGQQDISYQYAAGTDGVGAPPAAGLTVGAENLSGTAGGQIDGVPSGSYAITSVLPRDGESLVMKLAVRASSAGARSLESVQRSDVVVGSTIKRTPLIVRNR